MVNWGATISPVFRVHSFVINVSGLFRGFYPPPPPPPILSASFIVPSLSPATDVYFTAPVKTKNTRVTMGSQSPHIHDANEITFSSSRYENFFLPFTFFLPPSRSHDLISFQSGVISLQWPPLIGKNLLENVTLEQLLSKENEGIFYRIIVEVRRLNIVNALIISRETNTDRNALHLKRKRA